jgi:hypothetical protein
VSKLLLGYVKRTNKEKAMKKLLISIILFFMSTHLSFAEVDNDYLQKINKMVADKQYSQALDAYKYFFEESKNSSGMGGVRVSFALSSWAELGKVYPPAYDALVKMSNDRKTTILAGKGTFNLFQEYESINSYINKNNETLETFLFVHKNFPSQAPDFYVVSRELIIEAKQYDLVKIYTEDLIYAFESLRNRREYDLSQFRKDPKAYSLEYINSELESKTKKLINLANQIGMTEEATEIKNRYSVYINGNLLRKYH